MEQAGFVRVINSTVISNTAFNGGALSTSFGIMELLVQKGSVLADNRALGGDGGAIWVRVMRLVQLGACGERPSFTFRLTLCLPHRRAGEASAA